MNDSDSIRDYDKVAKEFFETPKKQKNFSQWWL